MPSSGNRRLTIVALLLATFMAAMEATVVATAMPTVVADLGGIALYGWVGSAYLLASTVTVPLFGKLADTYGRRPILLGGIAVFLTGSIACGMAQSIGMLIVARAFQGIGAGGIQPISMTVIGDLYRVEERGRVQGLFGAVWGVSGVVGPLLGGLIVKVLSWHWVFWINVPFGIASVFVLLSAYRELPRESGPVSIDWLGALLLTCGSLTLLFGAGGTQTAWMLGATVLLFGLFALVERRAKAPIVPFAMMAQRHVLVATVASVLSGAAMMGSLIYLPLYVQGVLDGSPTEAGSVITPMLVGWPLTSALSARFIVKSGFRAPVWAGGGLIAVATAALYVSLSFSLGRVPIGVCMFLFGCGMGLMTSALIIALQASVTSRERGVVTAINMFARSIGGALGVGALGALFAARLATHLDPARVEALLSPTRATTIHDDAVANALDASILPVFLTLAIASAINAAVVLFYPKHVAEAPESTRAGRPSADAEPSTAV